MEGYKRGGHRFWDCKYHLVWVTKYRYPVLGGDVGNRCRELLRETARAHEMVVHAGSTATMWTCWCQIPPSLSISRAVQYLKGRQFAKIAERVRDIAQARLGPAPIPMGERLLGGEQRELDR
ncbi:IS200/IS605 family transposase [Mesorhizobium sp. C277A]|uniref:IS200/IS605 family transposase n=1 Tax=Mesorhizobium sp. C277A TaxID=2956827 RepID=UPI0018DBBF5D